MEMYRCMWCEKLFYVAVRIIIIIRTLLGSFDVNSLNNTELSRQNITVLKAGVLLTNGSGLPYDFDIVQLALEAAYERVFQEYDILFRPILYLYGNRCSTVNVMGQTYYAGMEDVDLVIGPGCTDDMMSSLELQTYFKLPSITGAGDLVDSSAKFPYLTRCSYNTYTQWIFFTRLCVKFKWTNVAIIFDRDDFTKTVNANSLEKNLKDNPPIRPYSVSFDSTTLYGVTDIQNIIQNASLVSRVFVLLMDGLYVRQFMIQANYLGKLDGTYVFFSLDLFRDDLLQHNGWQQGDVYDSVAREAFQSLLIVTLRNTQEEPAYKNFSRDIQRLAAKHHSHRNVSLNYYVASFYDSVMLYGKAMSELLTEGKSIKKDNVVEVSQKYWNRTIPGATGQVYINPDGDRNDDHALYAMTSDGKYYVVAEFYGYKDILVPDYLFDQLRPFPWRNPTNTPPSDKPRCGFAGEDPVCDKTIEHYAMGAGISAGLVILSIIITFRIRHVQSRKYELAQLDILGSWSDLDSPYFILNSNKLAMQATHIHTGQSMPLLPDNDEHSVVMELSKTALLKGTAGSAPHAIGAVWKGSKVIVRMGDVPAVPMNRKLLKEIVMARGLNHQNTLMLQGLCVGPPRAVALYYYCAKGTLFDLLSNTALKLDSFFLFSFLRDIVQGLVAIQRSPVIYHGRLTSKCCYVDGHFTCRIADYGLPSFFERKLPSSADEQTFEALFWTAPEHLLDPIGSGSPEGDVYSLAIIMQETVTREPPFGMYSLPPSAIIAKVRHRGYRDFRPRLDTTRTTTTSPELLILIKQCWAHSPMERPRLLQVKKIFMEIAKSHLGNHVGVIDRLIFQMEEYAQDLEHAVQEKTNLMLIEKDKSERLLYQILPRSIAEQLKRDISVPPESYDSVSVQYSDVVSFTKMSSESTPTETVDLLNDLFTLFDSCIVRFDAYKVETIGDCYVVASGVPIRNGNKHCIEISRLALMVLSAMGEFKIRHRPNDKLRIRLGIHTGPCLAGVVGRIMPRFCLFGETILIAARMESTSEAMRIQISEETKRTLETTGNFDITPREHIQINEHKFVLTYWLNKEIM